MVNVSGATIMGGVQAGQLNFRRVDGVPTLYAVSGGEATPVTTSWPDPTGR